MDKLTMREVILEAKQSLQISWEMLGNAIGMSPVWTASVCLGENSMSAGQAQKLCAALELPAEVETALQEYPLKGTQIDPIPTDPLIYRFHEVMMIYGETAKAIIHEKFGDGIMSAIDFTMDIARQEDPKGDRVVITLNGKFLPYKQW